MFQLARSFAVGLNVFFLDALGHVDWRSGLLSSLLVTAAVTGECDVQSIAIFEEAMVTRRVSEDVSGSSSLTRRVSINAGH